MYKCKVPVRSSFFEPVELGFGHVGTSVLRICVRNLFSFVNIFCLQVVHSGDCGLLWLSMLWGQKVTSII